MIYKNQADNQYNELVNDIIQNGYSDEKEEVRTKWKDGTPAHTKSVFGWQATFNDGEIPLLSSKKVGYKTALKEILLFWQKQTVQEKDFHDMNVHVWDEWFKDGNIGRSYAYQFESHRHHVKEIIEVPQRIRKHHGVLSDNVFGYERNVFNTGNKGNIESVNNYTKEEIKKIRKIWYNMLKRCYDITSNDYHMYGGIGVFVDERWHLFENFLRDIRYLPQFFLARENNFENWNLDKDYYSSNCYSLETCVWLTTKENSLYRKQSRPIYLVDKDGNKYLFLSIKQASQKFNFDSGEGSKYLNGKAKSLKGYHLEYANDFKHPLRYELSKNQVIELLNNIQNNPASRRLMTSFWNYADVNKKNLQECAWTTNWNVRKDILDVILIQRSADIALGLPFNWIQYYLLLCMIAHVSNLKVGKFIHQIGNAHYYDKHEEGLIKQMNRDTYEQPEIWINPDVKDFFDFTLDDIKIIDYKHGEPINFEVAI